MNARKILYPTDFSEYSEAALAHAAALARDTGAKLVIVHVKEPPDAYVDTGFAGYPVDINEAELIDELSKVKPTDPDVPYSHRLLTGDPAAEISRFAEKEGVDMIVLGTHGRRGLTRMLMGSVAEAVVRSASCPVLTIKQPSREKVEAD